MSDQRAAGKAVAATAGPEGHRRSAKGTLAGILALVVVAGIALVVFGGVFDLAFHIAEYVVLALAAGWVGYKIGHMKGRREHRGGR